MNKKQLRQQLLQQRSALTEKEWQEKSDRICTHLQSLPVFQSAQTILAYFSFRQEPNLEALFTLPKIWGFPRCVKQQLHWQSWQPGEALQKGKYGIQTPLESAPSLAISTVDLILVPTVACNSEGYRLGYGGGYYDRLLEQTNPFNIPTLGIVFEFGRNIEFSVESWDQKLQGVCTELQYQQLD